MKWKWITWIVLVVAALVCVWVSFWHFHSSHVDLPEGCDQFGYLYQAEAVRNGTLFGEHTPRPFLNGIVGALSASTSNPRDYNHIVAPHAYHYDDKAGKVINQYPPGTAFLLSIFPKEYRKLLFPAFMTALMCPLLLLLRKQDGWRLAAGGSLVIAYMAAIMAVPGGRFFYQYVGSEAPVIPLLIAAGWFLRTRPMVSLALVSFTVIFRIADVWLLPVLALPALFKEWLDGEGWPTFSTLVVRAVKIGAVCFISGMSWILTYQWIYLGNPLRTTYADSDQVSASLEKIVENLAYYFAQHPISAIITLAAFAGVALLYSGKGRRWVIVWSLLLAAWNYLFFVTHDVHAFYYPFATAYILFGLCLAGLDVFSSNALRISTTVFALAAACALYEIWPDKWVRSVSFFGNAKEHAESYKSTFGKADVVWADVHSSTLEYAAGIPAMRPNWGSDAALVIAIQWLNGNGYRQAFYLDDADVKPDLVLEAVRKSGLNMTIETDAAFGRVGWIEPVAK